MVIRLASVMKASFKHQYRLFDEVAAPPAVPVVVSSVPAAVRADPSLDAMQICVLGSGSGGNSTVVRIGAKAMLIDAGFGPMTTARRLHQIGLKVSDLAAICITHLDQDHFRPTWIDTMVGFRIPLYLHRWHRDYLDRTEGSERLYTADLVRFFEADPFTPWKVDREDEQLAVSTVRLPHDAKGTSAFHLCSPHGRIGLATDLGHVPDEMIEAFAGVDVLLIECNYDPQMQLTSSRPVFLKKRIMGDHGHLSNEQSLQACQRIADASPAGNPQRIVLLHRSQQCNSEEIVREVFNRDARFAGRVMLTQQRRRTPWIPVRPLAAMKRDQLKLSPRP